MLTVRAFQIANKILMMKRSIRIKDLSEMFHVSERSIKYDLDNIRYFFEDYNLEIRSQSGKGIWVDITDEKREEIIQVLAKMQQENLYYDQSMRINMILLYLFMNSGFVTARDLSEYLYVNRNTILSDMDVISEQLQKSEIVLERKLRAGYRLTGKEQELRSYFETQIQKILSVYDVYLMTERIKTGVFKGAIRLKLPDKYLEHYDVIETTMHKLYYDSNIEHFQKDNIILLMIRLMISIVRVQLGYAIGQEQAIQKEESDKYSLSYYWAKVFEQCSLPVFREEIYYIEGRQDYQIEDIDIVSFTADLMKHVGEKTNFPYEDDTTLYSRILAHLTLSLKEEIKENPFNTAILKYHLPLFLAVKEVCHQYLPDNPLIHNDSFICYIVLHFMVSHKNVKHKRKINTVFVCATGRGAAKLIEKKMESEIRELEMTATCSLAEAEQVIFKYKPDLVISVFPLESVVPVVVVEPVPTKENIDFIKKLVGEKTKDTILTYDGAFDMLDFELSVGTEGISQQIIIKGLNIYSQIINNEELKIKKGLEYALLTHVMLMVHRYHFNKQYCNIVTETEAKGTSKLRNVMQMTGVFINDDELKALLNYLEE